MDDLSKRDVECLPTVVWDDLRKMLPVSKDDALADCLRSISMIPTGTPEEPGLLPLLFIISCVTESPEQTWAVLKRVEVLSVNFCLGNMNNVGAFVHEIWWRRVQMGHWHDWRGLLARSKWDLISC